MNLEFSEIERDALSGKIPMTLEILEKCFTTCLFAEDEQEYNNIKMRFPELTDALGWEKPYVHNHHFNPRFLCGGWQDDDHASDL